MSLEPAFGVALEGPYFDETHWTSPLNYLDEVRAQMQVPDRVLIHDVTLRDGEQTARVVFTPDEKIALALELDRIGVHSIEPGLPATPEDQEVIKTLSAMKLKTLVKPLVRVREDDLANVIACGAPAMVLEFGINPYLLKYAYRTTPEELTARIAEYSTRAKEAGMEVEFMGWDAFRIPSLDYLHRFFGTILEKGRIDRITVSDTFGMAHPVAMRFLFGKLREWFPGVPLGLHIHNDFGLATAGAIAAVCAGATSVHSSFNGLGERAGNVATEELAMALTHLLGIPTGIRLDALTRVAQIFEEVSKKPVAANKPIVGKGLFEVESGIVVHVLRQFMQTPFGERALLPFHPSVVGQRPVTVIAGRGTGRNSTALLLEQLGRKATDAQADEITARIKSIALVLKNGLSEAVLKGIVDEVLGPER